MIPPAPEPSGLCPKGEERPAPFDEDVHELESPCLCCAECRAQCADDI